MGAWHSLMRSSTYVEQSPAYWPHNSEALRSPHRRGPNGSWVLWFRSNRLDRLRRLLPRRLASYEPPVHARLTWALELRGREPTRRQDLRPSLTRQLQLARRHV